ncbi:hypothetical protein FB451DRAFT_1410078 [Mycena latifolia]|nr:hypothetical protein FB451DRAFT_1410078 [Mycena latifolia]
MSNFNRGNGGTFKLKVRSHRSLNQHARIPSSPHHIAAPLALHRRMHQLNSRTTTRFFDELGVGHAREITRPSWAGPRVQSLDMAPPACALFSYPSPPSTRTLAGATYHAHDVHPIPHLECALAATHAHALRLIRQAQCSAPHRMQPQDARREQYQWQRRQG